MMENVDVNPKIDVDNNQRTNSLKGCASSCSKWLSHLITPLARFHHELSH